MAETEIAQAFAGLINLLQILVFPVLGWIVAIVWEVSHKVREIDTKLSFIVKNGNYRE